MKGLILLFISFYSLVSAASDWIVEAEGNGGVTWSADSVADIHAPGGLTLWNTNIMKGDVVIEYDARIVSDGRISDLNCFWMASMGDNKSSPITKTLLKERGGKFLNTYAMQLYYMGYGGNYNSTTRFRRYTGDRRGIDSIQYRPAILREYLDSAHLLKPDHWYHVRLEQSQGHARYFIDGECLVDYVDISPLTQGYFGFRTTLAHAQLRNFRYSCKDADNAPIVIKPVGGRMSSVSSPQTFGVPFGRGELQKGNELTVKTSTGEILNSDQWTLATWDDGSVKWQAVATVVPQGADSLIINKSEKASKKKKQTSNSLEIITSNSGNIVDSVMLDGKKVLGRVWLEQDDTMQRVQSTVREQSGAVRNCWRMTGSNFVVRLYSYSGSNELKFVYTLFIDSLTNKTSLRSAVVKAEVPLHGKMHERKVAFLTDSTHVMSMDVKPLISRRNVKIDERSGEPADSLSAKLLPQLASWNDFRLSQLSPNAYSIRKRATSSSPWIGTIEGHRAPGVVVVGDKTNAVGFSLTDFWQSYPSTLQVEDMRKDCATVGLYLWSKEAEPMLFEHYDTVAHGLEAAYEDVQQGMSTADGIARTTTFYINLQAELANLPVMAEYQQYLPTSEYLHRKRAFGIWSMDSNSQLDNELRNIMSFYAQQQELHGWYGFFNYGDVMHSYDVSRGEWRYDVGGYAWDNTELGTPAMLWYEFLRTGDSRVWQMAVAMTRHNSEVDCYHRGANAGLGTRHNVLHWGDGAKEARISQAFWNRFMYYLTADERLGDIMHEVVDADQMLYHLDPMRLAQPRSERYPCTAPARLRIGPDWLAYAGNWFTEWERTGNTLYRDKILHGMESIAALPHGIFSGPKALGYNPADGTITWEGDTAVQNTNHLLTIMGGFEMMNEMMLSISTPAWKQTWLQHAMDYKEKAQTISRNHFRVPRLQAYAWWYTGKNCYRDIATEDLKKNDPFKMLRGAESLNTIPTGGKGGFFTNDAATFTLDAIFLQETMK